MADDLKSCPFCGGAPQTGRAWDLMRRAGDVARAALDPAQIAGGVENE